jgi:hypothetical protein
VGTGVGGLVGTGVGRLVGTGVGRLVGTGVLSVGTADGIADGPADAIAVGADDGPSDGDDVGVVVGLSVGAVVTTTPPFFDDLPPFLLLVGDGVGDVVALPALPFLPFFKIRVAVVPSSTPRMVAPSTAMVQITARMSKSCFENILVSYLVSICYFSIRKLF